MTELGKFEESEIEENPGRRNLPLYDRIALCKTRKHTREIIGEFCAENGIDEKEYKLSGPIYRMLEMVKK